MVQAWLTAVALAADEAAPAAARASRPWYELILDNSLGIMLILVFLAAIIGTFVGARNRDRCLKKFNRFSVTIIEQAGRAIWGTLRVFSNGVEILFSQPFAEADGTVKESFLYYQSELARILTITRYLDEITDPKQQSRRRGQLRKMARPGLFTRIGRRFRNLINTFRDAIVKSFGMAMTQVQQTSKSKFMQTGGKDLTSIGGTIIGETGNAYEPMLEQYFGREVVAEIINPADPDKTVVEVAGYLGEYSAANVLLVDCRKAIDDAIAIPTDHHLLLAQQIEATRTGTAVTVRHSGTYPATVTGAHWGDTALRLSVDLKPDAETTFQLDAEPPAGQTLHLHIHAVRTFDVIIPRAVAAVRHRASFPADA